MRTNWAGNYIYQAPHLRQATTMTEAQETVAAARKVRVLGSRHSFNGIADSKETQLSLAALNKVLAIDAAKMRVEVEGGIRYGDLAPALQEQGLALANLASLPHISVAGAVATATHGSGSDTGNLATSVVAMDIITASGEIVSLSRDADGDTFAGAVVNLGALGAVARMTLEVEPTYQVRQDVYVGLSHNVLASDFDAIFGAAKSVSVFTDWRGATTQAVWLKQVVDAKTGQGAAPAEFFGAVAAAQNLHPLPGGDAAVCTPQMGAPGAWHERLPHFRMAFTPSNGAEIQAEYFLPRDTAARAIAAMRQHGDRLAPVLMISELRTIAADNLWLSPAHRGPCLAIHFTFKRDWEAIQTVLPAIEATLGPLGAVPHWGKLTTMPPAAVMRPYGRLGDFRDLAMAHDEPGKFRNSFVQRFVFGEV
ncbi:MAG: FAD-binding protein [Flavimaricola sp.]|nr:FAD-binding protein [Flavimaricola sp.]